MEFEVWNGILGRRCGVVLIYWCWVGTAWNNMLDCIFRWALSNGIIELYIHFMVVIVSKMCLLIDDFVSCFETMGGRVVDLSIQFVSSIWLGITSRFHRHHEWSRDGCLWKLRHYDFLQKCKFFYIQLQHAVFEHPFLANSKTTLNFV